MSILQWVREHALWYVLVVILVALLCYGVQSGVTYQTGCPPCPTLTPHPYDTPVKVPASSIVLPTVDWNPYPLPLPIGESNGGVFAAAAVTATPAWWNMPEAQRRLSKEVAMSKLYGAGGKLQGLAAFEADRKYQIAWKYDLGYMMTNSFEACAGGECWPCMAFRDAVVCERKSGEVGVIEWSVGPQIQAHVTPEIAPPGTPLK